MVVKVNMSHNRPNSYSISVQGVPSIRRAIINIKDKDDARGKKHDKELLVEGYGLQKVMTTQGGSRFSFIAAAAEPASGIVGEYTTSNHVIDRKSTRLNSSHSGESRMPSSA